MHLHLYRPEFMKSLDLSCACLRKISNSIELSLNGEEI